MSTLRLSLLGIGARIALMGVNMVSVILLARFLEPHGRGEYFLFQTLIAVLSVFADFGLSQSANVFMGKHVDKKVTIHTFLAGSACVLWVGISIVGGAVLWLFGDRILPEFPVKWQLAAFAVLPVTLYAGFWNSMMIGLGEIGLLNLVQLIMSPFQLVLILILVVGLSGGVTTAVCIFLATMLLQFVLMVGFGMRKGLMGPRETGAGDLSRQMLTFGLRGYPNAIATMLWIRAPIFLLNVFHGPVQVGVFSVAQQLAERLMMPVQAVQDAIYRKMSVLSDREAIEAMNRYLRLVSCGMVGVIVTGIALAPWIVVALFGEAYRMAAYVFWILLFGVGFVSIAMIVSTYMLSQRERPGLLSMLAGANAFICVVLSMVFIPAWAEAGAAAALSLTQMIGTAVVFAMYLSMSSTPIKDVLLLTGRDVEALVMQLSRLIGWGRAKA